jgi:methylenetetrahydrofolate dehydrogenase (NADP+) / methenyltetrahydrofolate cyclohydrolase
VATAKGCAEGFAATMSGHVFDGLAKAEAMIAATAQLAEQYRAAHGRAPRLAALCSKANPAAQTYWNRIVELAGQAGVECSMTEVEPPPMIAALEAMNHDLAIDAILPLAPFPEGLAEGLAEAINPAKDVEGLSAHNAGLLARGLPGLRPCTALAAVALAEQACGPLRGMTATVVGASFAVGRPLAELLLQAGATVTVAHVETRDLAAACRTAELLFVAVGKPGLIKAGHVSPGATIIDIGINFIVDAQGARTVVGDVDLVSTDKVVRAISAVPDGVGPLTTAFLIDNTVRAACALAGREKAASASSIG